MISLCVIALNESECLPKALANVKDFVQEIVVVDGGSTDDTVTIAHAFGAKTHHSPWSDHYSYQRNISLRLASHEWILVMDADELFEPALLRRLPEFVAGEFDAYMFPRKNFIDDVQTGAYPDLQTRLFRNTPSIYYRGHIHEGIHGFKNRTTVTDCHIIHPKTRERQDKQNAHYAAMTR